ncbi:alpha-2-macroglobulin family protein [Hirschia baltica]|uniref:Alpha-2-macroglobulin domain protein n=1 Tax=Hirschia baltica (strain ATCC 49814 / DSM 5838 / IFAM 1418) TaxID=582402 RepID=C6XMS7_HIRBI|nr:alpha-2-macroglobulin [Hirschia baltica]ACT59991.1 alpha-2-macroglobulin domain protein [Hirschia baltica ATCC 49814]
MRIQTSNGLRIGLASAIMCLVTACGDPNTQPLQNLSDIRDTVEGPEIEVRAEKARRAEEEKSKNFEFVRYAANTQGDAPIACLEFSHSLSSKTDYSAYIEPPEDVSLALDVQGSKLCIGGLGFAAATDLVLKAGLPGSGRARKLERDQKITIDFGDRPSYVGFKGDGVILPRVDADGLAIETVNVDTLKVSVSRVTDRALVFKSITNGFTAGRGEYTWQGGDEDPTDVSEKLWTGEIDVENSGNIAATTVFSLASAVQKLQPGAYYVSVEEVPAGSLEVDQPARAARWLIVTDLALTAYQGDNGLQVTARSIDTAKIARDVRLDLVARSNEILKSAKTDLLGRVQFSAPLLRGDGPQRPRMVMAYDQNGDFAVLDLERPAVDLSKYPVGGRSAPDMTDAYLYTERGIYRPGEKVWISALVRDLSVQSVSSADGVMRLYAPNGVEAANWRFEGGLEAGGMSRSYVLPKAAARGMWRIDLDLDGQGVVGSTRISVEDFVPQRIELKVSSESQTVVAKDETRSINADVRFLYGAPGAGLTVEGRTRVEVDPKPFADFANYAFGNHDEQFRQREFDLKDATADGAGQAVLRLDVAEQSIKSSKPLRLRTVVSAMEPGGRAVRDDIRMPYRPNDVYVGVLPEFDGSAAQDEAARLKVVALQSDGAQIAGNVNWSLVRIDWDYDWYRTGGGAWKWRRTRNVVPIQEGDLELSATEAAVLVTRSLDWGDYELVLTEEATGATASYGFWAGWGGGPQEGVEAPDRVRISAPKDPVEIGKKASYTILPPYAGEAEIVVANDNIIETRTLTVPEKGLKVDFNVTEKWGAGAYVMVSVFTPRDPVARPRPRRAVGVSYAPVDVKNRTFELDMKVADVVEPRQKVTIELEATGGPRGEKVFATLAAVDEGILQLTKFESPNPSEHFFAKRRLGVMLKDDYGRLLDPNQGAAAEPRSGGDQIGGAGLTVVPTKSVALFSGIVAMGRDGKAEIELDLPDFNGELRLMAVVWSDTGMGAVDEPLTVRDDVPAEVILPRFLAPGDTAIATVTMDNVAATPGNYDAALVAGKGVEIGDGNVTAMLKQGQRADIAASISASSQGVSNINMTLTGPNNFQIEREYGIEVRSPYLPLSRIEKIVLQPGESWTASANALNGFVAGSSSLMVSASAIPMDASALYKSLSEYPYGCTEQTVSRALPLLYAENLAGIAGLEADAQISTKVQEAVSTLLNRQSSDGSIGLWRMGDRNASPWVGAYAVDFIARAKAAGYLVPDAALEKAYTSLAKVAAQQNQWGSGYNYDVYTSRWHTDTQERLSNRAAAYAAYVLARGGKIEASRLRYLHDEMLGKIDSPLAKAQIGAALHFMGDNARSVSAFDAATEALGYDNTGDYYQTPRRDRAGVLALAGEIGDAPLVADLTEQVVDKLPDPDRLTTQEKAFLLMAANSLSNGASSVELTGAGKVVQIAEKRSYYADEASFDTSDSEIDVQPTFTNEGEGPLWLTSVARGAPVKAPPAVRGGLSVSKSIFQMNGRNAQLGDMKRGDQAIVALSVRPLDKNSHPLIIADLLPAGWEIQAVLTPNTSGPYSFVGDLSYADVAEARDDRFLASLTVRDGEQAMLAYVIRAVTPGDYALPGAVAEDMYRADVFGRTSAGRVKISAE